MATLINELCVNCGACEPVCPSEGIHRHYGRYEIDPALCMECVGSHPVQQCQSVCPIDGCCVPDPERVETEEVLFERALKIASATNGKSPVLTNATSHFRANSLPWWRRLVLGI
ncbi:MAG: 4Fe-4S ferredoxin [Deltaproteobacteria bacterium]|nr:4Fe-4S ferredoxin [Deltaproteobacteria bacterium]